MRYFNKDFYKLQLLSEFQYYDWLRPRNIQGNIIIAILDDNKKYKDFPAKKFKQRVGNFPYEQTELNYMIIPNKFNFFDDYDPRDISKCQKLMQRDFEMEYKKRLYICSFLPPEILKRIADVRLLALGYAPEKIKSEILQFSRHAHKKVEEIIRSNENEYKNLIECIIKQKGVNVNHIFDEEEISEKQWDNSALILKLKSRTVTLVEAQVTEEEGDMSNTSIELFEFYKTGSDYELHLLLSKNKEKYSKIDDLFYVTINFKDFLVK